MSTGAAAPSLASGTPPAGDTTAPGATGTPPPADPNKPSDPPADPSKAADPAKVAEPAKAPDAPAAFALDKVKLPEGMKADDPTLKLFGDVLGDDKLSPADRGQKLLDLYADVTKKGREAATEAWNNVNKEWSDKTIADPEIGGAKWEQSKVTIAKAIDSLGPALAAEVRTALDITGAGNHPAIVKALHSFAAKLVEGRHIGGSPPSDGAPKSVKEAFYPNSPDMK